MIKITANGVCARAQRLEPLTSGMVGAKVEFVLSPDFDGLTVTAVFTNGAVTKDILNPGDECFIPPEVLETAGKTVKVGIYAVRGSELVIPTVYAPIGVVLPGADPSGDTSTSATLPVVRAFNRRVTVSAFIALKLGFGYQIDPCIAVICAVLDVPAVNTHCD